MGAIDITISGVLYDKTARTTRPVVIIGEASLTGLGVGGGPIIPPDQPPVGGGGGTPSHPIALPGDPWWGGDLKPSHPIALPGDPWWPKPPIDPPVDPPTGTPPGTIVKPPPPEGGWAYSPEFGWGYYPKPGEPGPKGSAPAKK